MHDYCRLAATREYHGTFRSPSQGQGLRKGRSVGIFKMEIQNQKVKPPPPPPPPSPEQPLHLICIVKGLTDWTP